MPRPVFSMPGHGPTGISNAVAFLPPLFLPGKGSNLIAPCPDLFLHCTKENTSARRRRGQVGGVPWCAWLTLPYDRRYRVAAVGMLRPGSVVVIC